MISAYLMYLPLFVEGPADQICVSPSRLRDFPDGIPIKLPGPWLVPAVRGVILGKWLLEPEGEWRSARRLS